MEFNIFFFPKALSSAGPFGLPGQIGAKGTLGPEPSYIQSNNDYNTALPTSRNKGFFPGLSPDLLRVWFGSCSGWFEWGGTQAGESPDRTGCQVKNYQTQSVWE